MRGAEPSVTPVSRVSLAGALYIGTYCDGRAGFNKWRRFLQPAGGPYFEDVWLPETRLLDPLH